MMISAELILMNTLVFLFQERTMQRQWASWTK